MFNVNIEVDALLNVLLHLMFRNKLINSNTQGFFNGRSSRVNQEVLWENGSPLNHCALLLHNTNGLHSTIQHWLCSRDKLCHFIQHQLHTACAIHSSIQQGFSNLPTSLVKLKLFFQTLTHISYITVFLVLVVILNIKPLATTKRSFFHLSNAALNSLLQGRSNELTTLTVTCLVLCFPLTTP